MELLFLAVIILLGFAALLHFSKYILENSFIEKDPRPYVTEGIRKTEAKSLIEYQKILIDKEAERMFEFWKERILSGRSTDNIIVMQNPYATTVLVIEGEAHYTSDETKKMVAAQFNKLKEEYVKNR